MIKNLFSVVSIKKLEIAFGLALFSFMLMHRSYLGLKEGLSLLPITILSLPVLIVFIWGVWLPRKKWVILLLLAVLFFYTGLRLYRGNANLLAEGDRDDAVVMLAQGLLDGKALNAERTFLDGAITTGPVSGVLVLPFVYFFGSNNVLSWILFALLLGAFYLRRGNFDSPLIGISMAVLVFYPRFNWCYWEAGEELLYGWVFIFPAVWIAGKMIAGATGHSLKYTVLLGVLLGLAVGVRIAYAIPVVFLLALLMFYGKAKQAFLAALIAMGVFFLSCLPYIVFSSPEQFFNELLFKVWLPRGKSGSPFLLVFVTITAFFSFKRKLNPAAGVILAAMAGHIYTGLFLIPWHIYYWILPIVFWLPDFGEWLGKRGIISFEADQYGRKKI